MADDTLFYDVGDPEQLKAFTDPLRLRVLEILKRRAATNQQIADELNQPPARVLHHVRVLADLELIRLVDTQIKGGNVEKYYRAVARGFTLHASPDLDPETDLAITNAYLERMRQDVLASGAAWPEYPAAMYMRTMRLDEDRLAEFTERLLALLTEYWERPHEEAPASEQKVHFHAVVYRDADRKDARSPQPRPHEPPAGNERSTS
jgi:DNA-binding transcriptional ArsR family regulator